MKKVLMIPYLTDSRQSGWCTIVKICLKGRSMEDLWSPWRMKYIANNEPPGKCIFCSAPAEINEPDNLIVHQASLPMSF